MQLRWCRKERECLESVGTPAKKTLEVLKIEYENSEWSGIGYLKWKYAEPDNWLSGVKGVND